MAVVVTVEGESKRATSGHEDFWNLFGETVNFPECTQSDFGNCTKLSSIHDKKARVSCWFLCRISQFLITALHSQEEKIKEAAKIVLPCFQTGQEVTESPERKRRSVKADDEIGEGINFWTAASFSYILFIFISTVEHPMQQKEADAFQQVTIYCPLTIFICTWHVLIYMILELCSSKQTYNASSASWRG